MFDAIFTRKPVAKPRLAGGRVKKILLRVVGVTLAIGCASPGAVGPAYDPGALVPAVHQQAIVASTVNIASQGTSAEVAYVANLQLPTGVNGTASGGSRSSGMPDKRPGGHLVSVEAVPEPSGGAMLLCALAVLAFIARRKI
jgi:hypothetical protein